MSERISIDSDTFWAYVDEHGGPDEAREAMRDVIKANAPGASP